MRNEIKAQLWARQIKHIKGIDVFENTRRREIVTYRALHVYMLRNVLAMSLNGIAQFYIKNGKSGYDHATVLHAINMFDSYCYYDKGIIETMSAMTHDIAEKEVHLELLLTKVKYIDTKHYQKINDCIEEAYMETLIENEKRIAQGVQKKHLMYD